LAGVPRESSEGALRPGGRSPQGPFARRSPSPGGPAPMPGGPAPFAWTAFRPAGGPFARGAAWPSLGFVQRGPFARRGRSPGVALRSVGRLSRPLGGRDGYSDQKTDIPTRRWVFRPGSPMPQVPEDGYSDQKTDIPTRRRVFRPGHGAEIPTRRRISRPEDGYSDQGAGNSDQGAEILTGGPKSRPAGKFREASKQISQKTRGIL